MMEPGDPAMRTATASVLFVDVVGSTELRARLGEEAADELRRRIDAGLLEIVTAHHGRVVKGLGDGLLAVFDAAADAVGAGVAIQQRAPDGVGFRVGVSTGDVSVEDADVFGTPVVEAARLCAAAVGGQVLVADLVRALARGRGGHVFEPVGDLTLKGLPNPVAACQVRWQTGSVAGTVPPAGAPVTGNERAHIGRVDLLDRPAGTRAPTRIPEWNTVFLGRDSEMATAENLLGVRRLVTFTGAGGSGKTRLAAELARKRFAGLPGGACYVDLAPVLRDDDVADTLRAALGLSPATGVQPTDRVLEHLRESRALILLDNCEHVLEGVRPIVVDLLGECPRVSILATSREPLEVSGEATYRVPSLALPVDARDADCAAVALFDDRARLARAPHGYAESAVSAVVELCRRLDGIPLAIELAAARCRTLTPDQILDQLTARLDVLAARTHGAPPRHRTLEASIDWSYRLLDEAERRVLRRLAIFAGTFTLPAAVAICASEDGPTPHQIEGTLAALVERSFIEAPFGTLRFRLLQTLRQFLLQELGNSGELNAVAAAHGARTVEYAAKLGALLPTADAEPARLQLEEEIAEIRAADDWLFQQADAANLFRLHGPLRLYWYRSHPGEGCERVGRAVELSGGELVDRTRALLTLIEAAQQAGEWTLATQSCARALLGAEGADDPLVSAQVHTKCGLLLCANGDERGRVLAASAIGYLNGCGQPYWLIDGLWSVGLISTHAGESATATTHFGRALELAQQLGHRHREGRRHPGCRGKRWFHRRRCDNHT